MSCQLTSSFNWSFHQSHNFQLVRRCLPGRRWRRLPEAFWSGRRMNDRVVQRRVNSLILQELFGSALLITKSWIMSLLMVFYRTIVIGRRCCNGHSLAAASTQHHCNTDGGIVTFDFLLYLPHCPTPVTPWGGAGGGIIQGQPITTSAPDALLGPDFY